MCFNELKYFLKADLYRYYGNYYSWNLLRGFFLTPGFKFTCFLRLCAWAQSGLFFRFSIYPLCRFFLAHYKFKFGIQTSHKLKVGPGLYLPHYGCIVINSMSVIGKNCMISPGVTIGIAGKNERRGVPHIGDNVSIGSGAKLIGKIKIGKYAVIGANCVVTKDVPDYATVVGIPGKVIGYDKNRKQRNTDYQF